MNWKSQCAAVVPCLNEEPSIGSLVASVREHLPTVYVVDDGSTDATSAKAAQAGAQVLRHFPSRGKGAALRAGWQRALQQGFGWALTLDGDGQHRPQDIPAFFHRAEQAHAGLVIGNRMGLARQMPWLRRNVNRWMSARLSGLAGRSLPDSQCGFRLLKLDLLAGLDLTAEHFEIESDLSLAVVRAGYHVEFVPIDVVYRTERSKIRPVRDAIRWWRWWRVAKHQKPKADETPNSKLQTPTCRADSARRSPAEAELERRREKLQPQA